MQDDTIGVNDRGNVVGEDHPRAKLSDHDVDLMRELYEEFPVGHEEHKGYRWLAWKFEVSRSTVRDIVKYRKRAQTATQVPRKPQ